MLLRLVHKVDFEGLMAVHPWSRSAHFALHHLPQAPASRRWPVAQAATEEISTGLNEAMAQSVDKVELPGAVWFGAVVPKRHARRAVTRSLLKRQIRAAFERHASVLAHGLWLVRLRRPLALAEFPSARSAALAAAARRELDDLLSRTGATRHGRAPHAGGQRAR